MHVVLIECIEKCVSFMTPPVSSKFKNFFLGICKYLTSSELIQNYIILYNLYKYKLVDCQIHKYDLLIAK